MKPIPQNLPNSRRAAAPRARRCPLPQIECSYHPGAFDRGPGGHRPARSYSLRSISEGYFRNEAPAHFASEAVFFAIIVVTAAVPVIEGLRGLAHWVL